MMVIDQVIAPWLIVAFTVTSIVWAAAVVAIVKIVRG